MRFLSMIRVNENGGQVPSEQLMHDMGKLIDEMTREGALVRTAGLRPTKEGFIAHFGSRCDVCPHRSQCTSSKQGRVVNVHAKHETLARMRANQKDPAFALNYKATRPKVERKIAHMMRRRHGGRRARMRGRHRIGHDLALLAASVNLSRLAVLGIRPPTSTLT